MLEIAAIIDVPDHLVLALQFGGQLTAKAISADDQHAVGWRKRLTQPFVDAVGDRAPD